jgi:preprotein translocase subunit YajC
MDQAFELVVFAAGTMQPAMLLQLLPYVVILAIFYFLILMPMKKRQKKVQEFQESLKVGDKIITTSGIYGIVHKLGDASVRLQVADRVTIEVARSSVAGYQGQEPVVSNGGGL